MKVINQVFCILLFFVFTQHSLFSQSDNFKLPKYEKFVLPNGLTIYLMEQHEVPLIYVSAILPAGAVSDGDKNGLSAITAEALMFGTKNYTKDQIEETFDFYGAELNTAGSLEYSSLSSYFLKDDQDTLLPIIKDVIVNPVFPKDEFKKRKRRWLVELDQDKESPRSVMRSYFNKFIFGRNPYGNPVSGTKEAVGKLTVDDLKDYYSNYYSPSGSAIAIVGDFSTSEMKTKLTNLFGDWENGETHPLMKTASENPTYSENRVLLVNKDDSHETTFYIGQFGVKRSNPDYTEINVVNTVFGGRFTSWLNEELRVNSGLTYGAWSGFVPYKTSGIFLISSFTKTSTTIEALDLALDVLKRLHTKGIDEETLNSAKNYIKGQFPPRYETSGELASLLTAMFFYNISDSYINDFQKNVDNLTVERANEIIRKYFPENDLQFVLIGKASELRDKVSKYGEVTEKEILSDGF